MASLPNVPNLFLDSEKREFDEAVADIARVTGQSHDSLAEADEALRAVIAENDPARDEALVQIFHRRILRLSMIIAGTDPNDENPLFYKLDPILG